MMPAHLRAAAHSRTLNMSSNPPPPRRARNARLGLWFFAIYCVFYAGFMGLTAFSFTTLAKPIAGVNWAILYGMGLIVAALVLAVVYMFLCTRDGDGHDERGGA
jgi:uncharacterized membrane protein (DUF485 family)